MTESSTIQKDNNPLIFKQILHIAELLTAADTHKSGLIMSWEQEQRGECLVLHLKPTKSVRRP